VSELKADWSRPYRVVQWATGNVGSRALRRVIEHPGMELVGLWVHSGDKIGKDAGELAGIAPCGIKATNDADTLIALKADCVLYMPHVMDFDEVCRMLALGTNVITTRTEFQNPNGLDPTIRAKVEAACREGNSSIHGTGSSPGFITEALPIVLTSIQRRLDCLTIYEFGDNATRNSPEMLFEVMGFGKQPGAVNEHMLDHLKHAFAPSLNVVAEAMGVPFESIEVSGAVATARKDTQIAAGLVPAGTVAATRTTISGMRGGKPLMKMVTTWFVTDDVETPDGEDWLFRSSGWRVIVEGDCPLDVQITFPVAQEHYAEFTPGLTAHRPVNCVPYVCAAPPGIVTTVDLPQIITRLA
jgi:4-hydroxy-tetrahydrodipicolinate reductase